MIYIIKNVSLSLIMYDRPHRSLANMFGQINCKYCPGVTVPAHRYCGCCDICTGIHGCECGITPTTGIYNRIVIWTRFSYRYLYRFVPRNFFGALFK